MKSRLLYGCAVVSLAWSGGVNMAAAQQAAGTEPSTLSEIVVTGTRRADRSVEVSSVPVDILSPKDLQSAPSWDLQDKLAQTVPSYTVQTKPLYGTLMFVRPASLRGLNPDQTLVLINGKRQHRTPFVNFNILGGGAQGVDLSQVAASALGRVEVLRDGAAAQYGSDAIAGVINLVLRDEPGYGAFVQGSRYYAGDGDNLQYGARAGWDLDGRGSVNLSVERVEGEATSRSLQREEAARLAAAGNANIRGPVVTTWGQPDLDSFRASLNGHYDLSEQATLYAFGLYGRTTAESNVNWRSPNSASFKRSIFQDAPYNIFPTYSAVSRFPGGYTPFLTQHAQDYSIVAGIRGELSDRFSYDISGNYGEGRLRQNSHDTLNPTLGPQSPTRFYLGQTKQQEWDANADFVYLLEAGLPTPVNVAFGGEFRREVYSAQAGEYASYAVGPLADLPSGAGGQVGLLPDAAGRWGRNNVSAYVDLDADLTSRFNVGLAGRFEDYADFGSTVNGKLSSRFDVTDGFSLRGAVSTGFRAPTPGQSNATNTQQSPDPQRPGQIKIISLIPATSTLAQSLGAKPLDAEKSVNVSAGFVARPFEGASITTDFYSIRVDDRLAISQPFTPVVGKEYQFFVNGFDTRTRGVDIVASYVTEVAEETILTLTAAGNYNETDILSAQPGVVSDAQRIALQHRLPEYSATLGADLRWGPVEVNAKLRYYGKTVDLFFDSTAFQQDVPGETFVDLAVHYDINAHVRLTVGAENLFDNYPVRVNWGGPLSATNYLDYGRKYPSALSYGTDGGRYYTRLSVSF